MDIAALIVAVLALLGAFLATRRVAMLQEQLDRTTSELHELRSMSKAALEELQNKVNDLRLQARRQAGQPIFEPRMTISEAMGVHPKVVDVLASFHLGGCSTLRRQRRGHDRRRVPDLRYRSGSPDEGVERAGLGRQRRLDRVGRDRPGRQDFKCKGE